MKRFFLIFFAICAAVATFADTFRRVSAPQADWTGEYLLVFESADTSRVFTGVDAAMGSEVVEITNSTISDYSGPTLVIAALADGGYSIAVNGGANNGKYISSGTSAPNWANGLKFNTTPHRVDLDYVDGSVLMSQSLQVDGQDTLIKMRFNDNPGQKRFRFYKTGQLPVQLYKLENGTGSDSVSQTINTIAEIKTMDDGTAVRLTGVVTHVYNKNVYLQDATGGMLLFFVVAPSLSVGDEVIVSGSKTTYGGAPEVQYSVVESVVSYGNTVSAPTFATLANACQDANLFTKVNVNNLEIVGFGSYNNPSVSDGADTLLCFRMQVDTAVFKVGTHVDVTAVLGYYNGYQFVGNAAGIQLAQDTLPQDTVPSEQPTSVTFNVIVPENTPDCYIAGNFNNWTHQQMTRLTDSSYTYVYSAVNLNIDSLEYKYCAGPDWAYVEKDADGYEIPNRSWQALDRVATWFAVPQDTLPQDTVPGEQPTSVTFNVVVPDNTPACYIAGNFNNWTHQQMTMVSDTSYTLTIDSVLPSMLEYKYCAGNGWEYVEVDADGYHMMNRRWQALDRVAAWFAVPGDTLPQDTVPGEQPTSVTFNVIVPENTPYCYIAGTFNNWTHQQMTRLTDSTYTYVYSAANLVIDSLEYKYCAGPDWAYVEKDSLGWETPNRRWQALDRVATWAAVPQDTVPGDTIPEQPLDSVAFNVIVPANTLDCYIAGNFNGWTHQQMTKLTDSTYTYVYSAVNLNTDSLEYKYCAGNGWEYVEKDANGYDVLNRRWQALDRVATWAAVPGDTLPQDTVPGEQPTSVTFHVVVPDNTPDCYIAGSFNGWTHQQMTQLTANTYTYTAHNVDMATLAYKYCAGNGWAFVEKDANGNDVMDRTWHEYDTVAAWANTSLVYNGLHYEITSMNTVSVIPASDNEGNGNYLWLTDVVIPDTVVFNYTTYQVTGIAEMAFEGCTTMTSLEVGENIEQVGMAAFYACSNLTSVVWNAKHCNSITYDNLIYPFFNNVQPITSFTIGNTVEYVPAALCAFMENLTSVTIPESVKMIDSYAFYSCSSLESITLHASLDTIGINTFNGCEGLTKTNFIGNLKNWCEMIIFEGGSPVMYSHNLYLNDVLLTHADIPEGTTMVNDYAFANDTCLISAKVPNSVEYIGLYAFNNCTNIRSIEVGNGVSELALTDYNYSYAFSECYNLQKFVYRSSLADDLRLGYYWLNATNLDTLIVPTEMLEVDDDWAVVESSIVPSHIRYLEVIDGELSSSNLQFIGFSAASLQTLNIAAVSNTTLDDKVFYEYYNLTNLSLPQNLQTIPYKMVADCYMLSSISIPSSVTSIGNNAFENCRSLSAVDFGTMTALQQIGNWAFYNCHNLPTLTIPEGVTYVGDGAFYGCSYLTELTLPSTMLTMGDNSFALCSRLQKMNVSAAIPPTIASKTFKDVLRSIPVYVPQPSVSLYKTDEYWKEFNIIGSEEQESGVDNISSEDTTKIYRDGQVLIYHNGTYYDMMGNVVE